MVSNRWVRMASPIRVVAIPHNVRPPSILVQDLGVAQADVVPVEVEVDVLERLRLHELPRGRGRRRSHGRAGSGRAGTGAGHGTGRTGARDCGGGARRSRGRRGDRARRRPLGAARQRSGKQNQKEDGKTQRKIPTHLEPPSNDPNAHRGRFPWRSTASFLPGPSPRSRPNQTRERDQPRRKGSRQADEPVPRSRALAT